MVRLDTPERLARHLVRYINSDRAIIAHVKRDFGVTLSLDAIVRFRAAIRPPLQYEPLATTEDISARIAARASNKRMVRRLGAYHG